MKTKPHFSRWVRWNERSDLEGIKNPGVYALAISTKNISGSRFEWIKEISYFGMTNSAVGLKGRLKQFDNTILDGRKGHGGAERFWAKHPNYEMLRKRLFVSVCPIECDTQSNLYDDLLLMGEITYLEYWCFAQYVKRYSKLPKFNDKKKALKSNIADR